MKNFETLYIHYLKHYIQNLMLWARKKKGTSTIPLYYICALDV